MIFIHMNSIVIVKNFSMSIIIIMELWNAVCDPLLGLADYFIPRGDGTHTTLEGNTEKYSQTPKNYTKVQHLEADQFFDIAEGKLKTNCVVLTRHVVCVCV